ncbi:growth/differentiatio [Aplochiton taeniatus]
MNAFISALSEQEGSWPDDSLKPRMKPESRYVKYMTKLYKISAGQERSSYGNNVLYNTVRLITPREENVEQSKEFFMQDLSYNLDRVRDNEQLLKSVLLYSFDQNQAISITSRCYLNAKEQDNSDQCQVCPGSPHTVSFIVRTDRRIRRKWVEVDVTSFLHPLIESQKKNIHMLVNLTCTEGRGGREGRKGRVKLTLRSPPLLLYLNDTSKLAHQRVPFISRSDQRSQIEDNAFESHMKFKPEQRIGHKKRRRRESAKSKVATRSQNIGLPDLLPMSEFQTSDCALYDFRVSFSQLKLDNWIKIPHKYNPRYCKGTCPKTSGFLYGSPVHTMMQNIINEKFDSSVPRASCVPIQYKPLSVLTFENDGSILYKEFEDMIATRCTCR